MFFTGCAGAQQDCPPPTQVVGAQAAVAASPEAQGAVATSGETVSAGPVETRVETTTAGELVVMQALTVRAPIAEVWRAYTTSAGWQAWVTPLAEVDLRVGGVIRTNYNPNGKLGDADTARLPSTTVGGPSLPHEENPPSISIVADTRAVPPVITCTAVPAGPSSGQPS